MKTGTHTPPFAEAKCCQWNPCCFLFLFVLWKIQPRGSSQETRHILVVRLWQQQVARTKGAILNPLSLLTKSVEHGDEKRRP